MLAPACNHGLRVVALSRWVISSLPARGQRADAALRGAARVAANYSRLVPAHFGGVTSCLGAAPAALGQSERQPGGRRADFGQAAGATWEFSGAGLMRPEDRTGPEQSHMRPPPRSWVVTRRRPSDCPALSQRQNSWGFFVKYCGRAT